MNCDFKFAARAALMQRSAVREFVKVTNQPGMISFAGGLPAAELFPIEPIRQAIDRILCRAGSRALQYGETEGVAELRDWLAHSFSTPSLSLGREHVLITSGAQQALYLLGQVLLDPGDVALVENPTYLALLSAWKPLGTEFMAVASDADGMKVAELDTATAARPKLAYVQPNFQNPQGTTLTTSRRMALAQWARQRGVFLVEDNPYGELRYEGEPLPHLLSTRATLPGVDLEQANVSHVGTFSKVLAPGLRIGWVIGPARLIGKLTQAKQAMDLHTSTLNQYLALELLQSGVLDEQLPALRAAYRTRRDVMLTALGRQFPEGLQWTRPSGGIFVMLTLPKAWAARELLPHALARRLAFVPGDEFHLHDGGRNTIRLNFSNATPEQIEEGITRLRQAVDDLLVGRVGP